MENQDLSRRTLLKGGGAALAELTVLRVAGLAQAFGDPGDKVIFRSSTSPRRILSRKTLATC